MSITKRFIKENIAIFVSVLNKFQGFGIMFSFDNPISDRDYFLFEIRFLYFKFYLIKYKTTKIN